VPEVDVDIPPTIIIYRSDDVTPNETRPDDRKDGIGRQVLLFYNIKSMKKSDFFLPNEQNHIMV
jgi:hypothetical protein